MELIDSHCHLTAIEPDKLDSALAAAAACDVRRMVCVGAGDGVAGNFAALSLCEKYDNIYAVLGVHPHDSKDHADLSALRELLAHPKVVAIGETGLDFYRDWAPRENQVKLFENSIAAARELKKPLVIHCRSAEEQTLDIIKQTKAAELGGVFHCYAGDEELAKKLCDLNFLVSFPGTLTFKKADRTREIARTIPLAQIMLETDTPYMAPEPFRGGPSEPKHIFQIALKLAEVKQIPLAEVARVTTENAVRLFRLPEGESR